MALVVMGHYRDFAHVAASFCRASRVVLHYLAAPEQNRG